MPFTWKTQHWAAKRVSREITRCRTWIAIKRDCMKHDFLVKLCAKHSTNWRRLIKRDVTHRYSNHMQCNSNEGVWHWLTFASIHMIFQTHDEWSTVHRMRAVWWDNEENVLSQNSARNWYWPWVSRKCWLLFTGKLTAQHRLISF